MANSTRINKGKGRQKIKMEKIQNESNLQVTFSKRRNGVFKKANELSILTGAEVAAIVFSPGGKVYTFGHPTVEMVIERFITGISRPLSLTQQLAQAQRNANVVEINANISSIKDYLEFERNRGEEIVKLLADCQNGHWAGADIDEQNPSQLQRSIVALKNTMTDLEREINARFVGQNNNGPPTQGYNYYSLEGRLPTLPLAWPTHEGKGSRSSDLPTLPRPISYTCKEGGEFFPFVMGPGVYGVGGGGGVLSGSAGQGLHNGVGAWSSSSKKNVFGGVTGSFISGPSSFADGGHGGRFPNTFGAISPGSEVGNGSGGRSFSNGPSSFRDGSGPFIIRPSPFIDDASGNGLPNTDGAGSSRAENNGVGSNTRVLEWDGSIPPNGLGGGF